MSGPLSSAITPEMRAQWEEAEREGRRREYEHRLICFGDGCISCGCDPEGPCVSHESSPRWTNRLLASIAAALEDRA